MKKVNIGLVVRAYDEIGNFKETRCENLPDIPNDGIMKDIIAGEVVCVQLTPYVEAFYFIVPEDWPKNWTELGPNTENNNNKN